MLHSITKTLIDLDSMEGVEQRSQVSTPEGVWEVCWDIDEERVVAWCSNNISYAFTSFHVPADTMTLADVLGVMGFHGTKTLDWCETDLTLEEVLAEPVKTATLSQVTVAA